MALDQLLGANIHWQPLHLAQNFQEIDQFPECTVFFDRKLHHEDEV